MILDEHDKHGEPEFGRTHTNAGKWSLPKRLAFLVVFPAMEEPHVATATIEPYESGGTIPPSQSTPPNGSRICVNPLDTTMVSGCLILG